MRRVEASQRHARLRVGMLAAAAGSGEMQASVSHVRRPFNECPPGGEVGHGAGAPGLPLEDALLAGLVKADLAAADVYVASSRIGAEHGAIGHQIAAGKNDVKFAERGTSPPAIGLCSRSRRVKTGARR